MARIEPLAKEEMQGETKKISEEIEKQFGMIPNLFATIARYPKALKPIIELYQAISKESSIDPKLQELAFLETSRINRCHYCLAHHTKAAKSPWLTGKQIEALKKGNSGQLFSVNEKTVIYYHRHVK